MSERTNQEPTKNPNKKPGTWEKPPVTKPAPSEKDEPNTQEVKPRSGIEINPGRFNEGLDEQPEPVRDPAPDEVSKSSQTQNREPITKH